MTRQTSLLATSAALALTIALAACGASETPARDPQGARAEADSPASAVADAAVGTPGADLSVDPAELEGNPFLEDWQTPHGVPPFDEIETAHFLPALKTALDQRRSEIRNITETDAKPTFENTIVALETSGALLDRVALTFGNIANTESTPEIRALEGQIYPLISREESALLLNDALWERVQAVYAQRERLDLDEQDARLLELWHREFERAGAALEADAKAEVARINERIATLTTQFGQNLLRSTKDFRLEITNPADLAGLSPDFRDAIKVEGEDKWVVGLDRSVFETFMTQSENRALREQVFNGYRLRASEGELDNGPILIEIAQLRAKRAELLGYRSHAEYTLKTRMAGSPEAAEAFLLKVWEPGLAQAKRERAEMQALVGDTFDIQGHDWWHYSERIRQDKYAFDDARLAPYFELDSVREGAFEMARRLFQVDFKQVDVPVWNEVVTAYEITEADTGEHVALLMMDMYARDSKRGGAWMSSYRYASDVAGESVRPVVTNNLNLIRPAEGRPTLMRFDEVETLFHEFGHGLHGALTTIRYATFSGVDGPRDYTEFPAQILEHWASAPEMLNLYAQHHETGETIPLELVDRLREASNHNQGFRTTEFIAASLLDLAWHNLSHEEALRIEDARAFEKEVLETYGLIPEIEPRYRSNYFAHIFAGGYSAGYYSYLWSEILDADGFYAFEEAGDIFDPELARRLKTWVYESGGLRPADELYRNFRGSDPTIDPLLELRGFKDPGSEG